jgi:hypothetical protein
MQILTDFTEKRQVFVATASSRINAVFVAWLATANTAMIGFPKAASSHMHVFQKFIGRKFSAVFILFATDFGKLFMRLLPDLENFFCDRSSGF